MAANERAEVRCPAVGWVRTSRADRFVGEYRYCALPLGHEGETHDLSRPAPSAEQPTDERSPIGPVSTVDPKS